MTLVNGALPSRLKHSAEYTKYQPSDSLHSILHDHNYSLKYSGENVSQFRILREEIKKPDHLEHQNEATEVDSEVVECVGGIECVIEPPEKLLEPQGEAENDIVSEKKASNT